MWTVDDIRNGNVFRHLLGVGGPQQFDTVENTFHLIEPPPAPPSPPSPPPPPPPPPPPQSLSASILAWLLSIFLPR